MKEVPYKAPDFRLSDPDDKEHTLADYAGRWLVLYFYPKDGTSGCTVEACSMRDARDELVDLGAEVVGISRDGASSHDEFKAKHSLNFTLLSDPEAEAIKAYGAWAEGESDGIGTLRKTFIINPSSEVVKVYDQVVPEGHGSQVIEDLRPLQAQG